MTTSKGFLNQSQRENLTLTLDRLIPATEEMPGAGALGLADFVERAAGGSPKARRLFTDGLTQLEIAAVQKSGTPFAQLDGPARESVLKELQAQWPAFFDALLRQCYNGYYTNPQVLELIGYESSNPADYQYQPLDETLLEPQRQRAPFWTQV